MVEPWMRVSDEEREEVVELLHGHMLAGRLTAEELEERVGEAWAARNEAQLDRVLRELPPRRAPVASVVPPVFVRGPAPPRGAGSTALTLGVAGLATLALSFGVLAMFALPLSVAAWITGASARRGAAHGGGAAFLGQVLGIVGSVFSLLILTVAWLIFF
jgi:Domain of unknown function (DUF1707)